MTYKNGKDRLFLRREGAALRALLKGILEGAMGKKAWAEITTFTQCHRSTNLF